MKYSIEQQWRYLMENGVERVRRKDEEFEFLLGDNCVVSPKQFWERLAHRISQKRPTKVVVFRIPIKSAWGDEDIIAPRVKEILGYATDADKRLDEKCIKELDDLTLRWNELQEIFHLVRFGVQQIPPNLSVMNEVKSDVSSNPTRHPRLKLAPNKKEKLYQRVRDDLNELYDTGRYQNWNEVYAHLSRISKVKYRDILQGISLTPGQIKGYKVNKSRYAPKSP